VPFVTTEVQGHRGAKGLRPENTLPGFAHAFETGVDAVELDVGLTADGVLVLHHDQALNRRICAGSEYAGRRIRELTLAQIKTVDAGRTSPHPLPGTPIPTLEEVCGLLDRYDPRPLLAIEVKTDPGWSRAEVVECVAEVARVVRAYGMQDRSRILGFDWRVLTAARRLAPEFGRVALAERKTLAPGSEWLEGRSADDWISGAADVHADMISPEDVITSPEVVRDAHEAGLGVAVWTVNEPPEMERFLDLGVDAIITDRPDTLRGVMESRGLPLPTPARDRRPDRVG
jgi:glycerophosphoryl diester phosphodiesterase